MSGSKYVTINVRYQRQAIKDLGVWVKDESLTIVSLMYTQIGTQMTLKRCIYVYWLVCMTMSQSYD